MQKNSYIKFYNANDTFIFYQIFPYKLNEKTLKNIAEKINCNYIEVDENEYEKETKRRWIRKC